MYLETWEYTPLELARERKIKDSEYWKKFTGEEFTINQVHSKLPAMLSERINPTDKIVNLMCGKYAYIHSKLGVDIAEQMLKANKEIDEYLLWDMNNSDRQYPIENESFNYAVMIHGIGYLKHPKHTFSEINRILTPEGKFFIGYGFYATDRIDKRWEIMNSDNRIKRVYSLCKETGFFVQNIETLPASFFTLIEARKTKKH
jgi:SAM-dependent methyltransferase